MTTRDDRMRTRLADLAGHAQEWRAALAKVGPGCTCPLSTEPGLHPLDDPSCPRRQPCRAMTVLIVQTHMGMCQVRTRHLPAAAIPALVDDLAALLGELPAITDWRAFATRLQAVVTTGRDPHRPTDQPSHPAEGAPRP